MALVSFWVWLGLQFLSYLIRSEGFEASLRRGFLALLARRVHVFPCLGCQRIQSGSKNIYGESFAGLGIMPWILSLWILTQGLPMLQS